MKKIILIITVILLTFSSCQKSEEYCWECVTDTYAWHIINVWQEEGWVFVYSKSQIHCGLTEEEIRHLEDTFSDINKDQIKTVTKCYKR
jgi:hypothetical protein